MKLSNIYLALMLVGVVVLAGCVGQPSGGGAGSAGSAGIVISSLLASPPQVYTSGSVVVSASFKNLGQATPKTDPTAKLFGLESWGGDCVSGSNSKTISGLVGADPTVGQQGGQNTAVWLCTAPSQSTINTIISYPFIVRTTYEYSTTFNGVMKAVTSDYFRQTNQQGGIVSQSYTSGPLTVSVQVPSVIAPSENIPVLFTVTNIGGGRVCSDTTCSGASLDKLAYKPTTDSMKCNKVTTEQNAVLGGGTNTVISCSVDASKIVQGTTANINLGLSLKYDYYVDASQTVTVLPIAGTSEAASQSQSPSGGVGGLATTTTTT